MSVGIQCVIFHVCFCLFVQVWPKWTMVTSHLALVLDKSCNVNPSAGTWRTSIQTPRSPDIISPWERYALRSQRHIHRDHSTVQWVPVIVAYFMFGFGSDTKRGDQPVPGQHGSKGKREGWHFQLPWHGRQPGNQSRKTTRTDTCRPTHTIKKKQKNIVCFGNRYEEQKEKICFTSHSTFKNNWN